MFRRACSRRPAPSNYAARASGCDGGPTVSTANDPVLGAWYRNLGDDEVFQVVVFDETDGVVELQFESGDVQALELDDWYALELESVPEPEEWSAAADAEDEDEEWGRRRQWQDDEPGY